MIETLLVLNAGSSSLKFSVFRSSDLELIVRGKVSGIGTAPKWVLRSGSGDLVEASDIHGDSLFDHAQSLGLILERLKEQSANICLVGVGHRVVHGGPHFVAPVRVTEPILHELEQLVPLAPLHQPHNLAAIKALKMKSPALAQVACFDTAFHRTQPPVAQWFGLPRRYTEQGVLRYGFHGLSYEYIASVLPTLAPHAALNRTIVAHLGNGASLCALRGGKSVATTMSFTPVDGLVMGTRVGSIDPGVLLYLMTNHGMDATAIADLIYHDSGLLGVSGLSSDMRTLLASADPNAAEAVDLFVYRIGREIGSLVATLGGLDALVFTGGIGENADLIRSRVCRDANWLGVILDEDANKGGFCQLNDKESKVSIWVIETNEELLIAEHTRRVLQDCEQN